MPLIITASIFLLLFCLTLFRVKLFVTYDCGFIFKLKYIFFSFRIKSLEEGKAKKHKAEKKGALVNDILSVIKNFNKFFEVSKQTFNELVERLRIDRLKIKLIICEEDAAKTAIRYGEACIVIYTAVAFISSKVDLKKHEIEIKPLFFEGSSEVFFDCLVSIRLGSLIWVALRQTAILIYTLVKINKLKFQQRTVLK